MSERCFILFVCLHPCHSIIHSFIHSFIHSSRSLIQFTCAGDDWGAPPPLLALLRLKEF